MDLVDARQIVLNKKKIILLIGVFVSLCAMGFKVCFTPPVTVQGDFVYNRIIQVEDETDYAEPNLKFNYTGLMNTNASFFKLIESVDGKIFDFSKINSAWGRKNELEKIEWLRERTKMNNFHDNVFEIVFTVPSSNISDLPYLEENVPVFMDALECNGSELICAVKPHALVKNVQSTMLVPDVIKNNKREIAVRYAVYGFIAGVFLSIAFLIGNQLFKEAEK